MRLTNQLLALGTALFVAVGVVGFMLTFSPASSVAQSADGSGWLGVSLQNLNRSLRDAMEIDGDVEGAVITDVVSGSPADRAGLQEGDVILEIDDEETGSVRDVIAEVRSFDTGDRIVVRVWRDGRSRSLPVTLGSRDEVRSRDRVTVDERDDDDAAEAPRVRSRVRIRDNDEAESDEDLAEAPRARSRSHERRVVVDVDESDGKTEVWVHEDGDEDHDNHRGKSRVFVLGDDEDGRFFVREGDDEDDEGNVFFFDSGDDDEEDEDEDARIWVERHGGDDDERVIVLPDSKRRVVIRGNEGRIEVIEDDRGPRRRDMKRRGDNRFELRSHGYLGVQTQALEDQLAEFFGVEGGVLVTEVVEDSPAETAGLKAGDVILSVEGNTVGSHDQLRELIQAQSGDSEVTLGISRNGRSRNIRATLGSSKDMGQVIEVEPLIEGLRGQNRVLRGDHGVLELHQDLLRQLEEGHGGALHELENLPDIEIDIPHIQGLHRRELHEGMQDLRMQINDLLEDLRFEIQHNSREWQREIGRAQRELQRTLRHDLRGERMHEVRRHRAEAGERIHRELRRSHNNRLRWHERDRDRDRGGNRDRIRLHLQRESDDDGF